MDKQTHIFLFYLLLIAIATTEVLMKLPFWINQGCPPFLFFWVFKMPFLVLIVSLFIIRMRRKAKVLSI